MTQFILHGIYTEAILSYLKLYILFVTRETMRILRRNSFFSLLRMIYSSFAFFNLSAKQFLSTLLTPSVCGQPTENGDLHLISILYHVLHLSLMIG